MTASIKGKPSANSAGVGHRRRKRDTWEAVWEDRGQYIFNVVLMQAPIPTPLHRGCDCLLFSFYLILEQGIESLRSDVEKVKKTLLLDDLSWFFDVKSKWSGCKRRASLGTQAGEQPHGFSWPCSGSLCSAIIPPP